MLADTDLDRIRAAIADDRIHLAGEQREALAERLLVFVRRAVARLEVLLEHVADRGDRLRAEQ